MTPTIDVEMQDHATKSTAHWANPTRLQHQPDQTVGKACQKMTYLVRSTPNSFILVSLATSLSISVSTIDSFSSWRSFWRFKALECISFSSFAALKNRNRKSGPSKSNCINHYFLPFGPLLLLGELHVEVRLSLKFRVRL